MYQWGIFLHIRSHKSLVTFLLRSSELRRTTDVFRFDLPRNSDGLVIISTHWVSSLRTLSCWYRRRGSILSGNGPKKFPHGNVYTPSSLLLNSLFVKRGVPETEVRRSSGVRPTRSSTRERDPHPRTEETGESRNTHTAGSSRGTFGPG